MPEETCSQDIAARRFGVRLSPQSLPARKSPSSVFVLLHTMWNDTKVVWGFLPFVAKVFVFMLFPVGMGYTATHLIATNTPVQAMIVFVAVVLGCAAAVGPCIGLWGRIRAHRQRQSKRQLAK